MTPIDLPAATGAEMSDTDPRAAAREMVRGAEAAGRKITGAELGRAFGKTDRWGRKQIERARSGHHPTAAPAGTPLPDNRPGRRNGQHLRIGTTPPTVEPTYAVPSAATGTDAATLPGGG